MRLIALFLIATLCSAQTPLPAAQSAAPDTPPSGTITVPQNTAIPLTLVNPIHSKSTKPGDAVRAMVAFPVTVGAQIAIPAGSYVEGTVSSLQPPKGRVSTPTVQIQFSRLLFANGYSASLDAINTQGLLLIPEISENTGVQLADARDGAPFLGEGFGSGQTTPQPPPLPRVGPSPAVIGGAVGGGAAVLVVLAIALGHHHANMDYTLFESGWQFQMTLQQPLTLDAAKVAAAAAATPAK